jgi:hypothetical protein
MEEVTRIRELLMGHKLAHLKGKDTLAQEKGQDGGAKGSNLTLTLTFTSPLP